MRNSVPIADGLYEQHLIKWFIQCSSISNSTGWCLFILIIGCVLGNAGWSRHRIVQNDSRLRIPKSGMWSARQQTIISICLTLYLFQSAQLNYDVIGHCSGQQDDHATGWRPGRAGNETRLSVFYGVHNAWKPVPVFGIVLFLNDLYSRFQSGLYLSLQFRIYSNQRARILLVGCFPAADWCHVVD